MKGVSQVGEKHGFYKKKIKLAFYNANDGQCTAFIYFFIKKNNWGALWTKNWAENEVTTKPEPDPLPFTI